MIINEDKEYLDLKNKMIGFKNQINSRETIENNIKLIKKFQIIQKIICKPQEILINGYYIKLTNNFI